MSGFMGVCSRCMGAMKVVVGVLILANLYFLSWEWPLFIGVLLIIGGLVKLVMPSCGHVSECCSGDKPMAVSSKKKK